MAHTYRRVYGADHEDPAPRPGRDYRELVGGPLDGLLLDVTGWDAAALCRGAALTTELAGIRGGRAVYEPRAGREGMWDWQGDCP